MIRVKNRSIIQLSLLQKESEAVGILWEGEFEPEKLLGWLIDAIPALQYSRPPDIFDLPQGPKLWLSLAAIDLDALRDNSKTDSLRAFRIDSKAEPHCYSCLLVLDPITSDIVLVSTKLDGVRRLPRLGLLSDLGKAGDYAASFIDKSSGLIPAWEEVSNKIPRPAVSKYRMDEDHHE